VLGIRMLDGSPKQHTTVAKCTKRELADASEARLE
jgi:hypothetical protein